MAPKDKFNLVLKILLPGFIFCFLFYYFKSLLVQPYAPLLETPFHHPISVFCDYYGFNDSFARFGFNLQHGGYLPGGFLFLQIIGSLSFFNPYVGIKLFIFFISFLFLLYIFKVFKDWSFGDKFLLFISLCFLNLPMLFMFHTGNFEGISFILILYAFYFYQKYINTDINSRFKINYKLIINFSLSILVLISFFHLSKTYSENKYIGKKIAKNILTMKLSNDLMLDIDSSKPISREYLKKFIPKDFNKKTDDYEIDIFIIKNINVMESNNFIDKSLYDQSEKFLWLFKKGWSYDYSTMNNSSFKIIYLNNLNPIKIFLAIFSVFLVLILLLNLKFKNIFNNFEIKSKEYFFIITLFLIALATSIKVFPVLFLLVFLRKKSFYKITYLFSIFLIFILCLPFIISGDFVENSKIFINSYPDAVIKYKEHMITGGSSLNIGNHSLFNLYHLITFPNTEIVQHYDIAKFILLSFFAFTAVFMFKMKSDILKLIFISSAICLFFPTSSEYRLIYFLIPLLLIIHKGTFSVYQKHFIIIISLILIPKTYIYFLSTHYVNSGTIFNPILLLIAFVYCIKLKDELI